MKRAFLAVRAAILWVLSLLHFFIVAPTLVFLGIFLDPRKHDYLQRGLCRRIVFLSGARLEVQRSPGFDPAAHLFFHGEPRQHLRSFFLVCRDPAVRARLGTGIALQNSRVWLADETIRQCAGAGCAASLGFETHVAADPGRHRRRH